MDRTRNKINEFLIKNLDVKNIDIFNLNETIYETNNLSWFILIPKYEIIEDYNKNFKQNWEIKNNKKLRAVYTKICPITNFEIKTSQNLGYTYCPFIKIFIKCNNCNKYFELNNYSHFKEILNKIQNNLIIDSKYCSNICQIIKTNNINKALEWRKNNIEIANKISIKNLNILQNFITKDNILYYFDRKTNGGNYIPWNIYKEKFLVSSKDIKLPKDFKIIPTFRTQDSEDWSNSKTAFEQLLLDLGIDWFVYIKFYINKNNKSIPLVCGKSGSLNVNCSGSDLSFSTDINDGPARRFLVENNLNWDKTKIAILKSGSEKDAYLAEQKYMKELNLFGS